GYGTAVTIFAILFGQMEYTASRKPLALMVILAAGALNFYMGFRSLGLTCLLTALFLVLKESKRFRLTRIKWTRVATVALIGGVSLYGVYTAYGYSASKGWLGEDEREKYVAQTSGDLGLCWADVNDSRVTRAIFDSPIIGHGSWAKDEYVEALAFALQKHGYGLGEAEGESDLIPSHSYITGAWVEAGILGAVFWIWALFLTGRVLLLNRGAKSILTVLVAFTAFDFSGISPSLRLERKDASIMRMICR
ncbi:MAG: hypothetical protein WKF37_22150, partial [Bryobacteraceae bacterium]